MCETTDFVGKNVYFQIGIFLIWQTQAIIVKGNNWLIIPSSNLLNIDKLLKLKSGHSSQKMGILAL